MSIKAKLVPAALAVGAVGGVAAALINTDRRMIDRWRSNPDPLNGVTPRFPDGEVRAIDISDGTTINTVTAGTGPTVVLVHGLTGSRHDWGPVGTRLVEAGFEVIAVEQRGHGDSTVGSDGWGIPHNGRDLARVLEALEVRDAVVAGHSMGGMATMTMALDHPAVAQQRVKSLVLVATRHGVKDFGMKAALRLGAAKITDRFMAAADRNRLATGLSVFGSNPSLFMVEAAMVGADRCPDETRRGATGALATYNITDRLGQISLPTSVVCGTNDKLTPLEENEFIAAHIPNAKMHTIDGPGHMIIWESVDELTKIIASHAAVLVA